MKQRRFCFISFFLCADFHLQNFSNLKKDLAFSDKNRIFVAKLQTMRPLSLCCSNEKLEPFLIGSINEITE